MPRYSTQSRDDENRDKLRLFEAAEKASANALLSQGKYELATDKMLFDQAYKLQEADRKAQESAAKLGLAEQRQAISQQQLDLQTKLTELNELKAQTKLADTEKSVADKIGFIKATAHLTGNEDDFEDQLVNATRQFPLGSADPDTQKKLDWTLKNRAARMERDRLMPITKGMKPTSATVDGVKYEAPVEEKADKPDTYEQFNKDLEEAKKTYTTGPLPSFLQKYFDERGAKLEKPFREAEKGQPGAPTTDAPAFKTADEVRSQFKAGKIPREEAEKILKSTFGMK